MAERAEEGAVSLWLTDIASEKWTEPLEASSFASLGKYWRAPYKKPGGAQQHEGRGQGKDFSLGTALEVAESAEGAQGPAKMKATPLLKANAKKTRAVSKTPAAIDYERSLEVSRVFNSLKSPNSRQYTLVQRGWQ